MIKTESFWVLFLAVYCPLAIVAVTLLYYFGERVYLKAALWGAAVSIALIWITVAGTNRLINSSLIGLQILVFGGFFFRFFIVIFAGLYVNLFTQLHFVSFLFGLFASYVVLQIIEITYVYRRFGKKS